MNILFVTAAPPWPTWGGASMRAYHFMRLLSARHRVQLICPGSVREELQLKTAFAPWCQGVFCVPYSDSPRLVQRAAALAGSLLPDLAVRMQQPALRTAVREQATARRIDLVHIVGLEAAASLFPLDHELGDLPLVLDELNAEHLLQERAWLSARGEPRRWARAAYSWLQARKLAQYEEQVGKQMSGIIATSAEDKAALEALLPDLLVQEIPNGVDTNRYCPEACEAEDAAEPVLLFTGTMDYRPNVDAAIWFAQEVLPAVRRRVPAAKFVVMGRNPTGEVLALADADVTITGSVTDDLPYFHRAAVFVLPMRFGGGTRLKLLQAMASGLPVVTTSMGASGVAFEHGVDGLTADTAEAFADAITTLLEQTELAGTFANHARTRAMEYDWARRVPTLEAFYLDVLARADARMRGR